MTNKTQKEMAIEAIVKIAEQTGKHFTETVECPIEDDPSGFFTVDWTDPDFLEQFTLEELKDIRLRVADALFATAE